MRIISQASARACTHDRISHSTHAHMGIFQEKWYGERKGWDKVVIAVCLIPPLLLSFSPEGFPVKYTRVCMCWYGSFCVCVCVHARRYRHAYHHRRISDKIKGYPRTHGYIPRRILLQIYPGERGDSRNLPNTYIFNEPFSALCR